MFKKILDWYKYGFKRNGLIDYSDDRNFGSQAVYTPTRADLKEATKETFIVHDPKPLDQMDNDHCVGFGCAYEADATENFDGESGQGSGSFIFACSKKWSGAKISAFGTTLLSGCMARVKWGICNKEQFDYKRGMRNWFSRFDNIPMEAFETAKKHKAGSAWQLRIPWGWTKFDAIVATLYHFRKKKVLIGTGMNAHRYTIIGYDKGRDCLIRRDTYGTRTLTRGIGFVTREQARGLFTSYFVLDIERGLADILVEYDRKVVKTDNNPDCYLIKGGEKHSLVDEETANAHGYLLSPNDELKMTTSITQKELDIIPLGEPLTFEGGKYKWVVRRIYERNNLKLKY